MYMPLEIKSGQTSVNTLHCLFSRLRGDSNQHKATNLGSDSIEMSKYGSVQQPVITPGIAAVLELSKSKPASAKPASAMGNSSAI